MINCRPQLAEKRKQEEFQEQSKPYRHVLLSDDTSVHYDYAEDLLVLYSFKTKQQTELTWDELRNLAKWTLEQDT